MFVQYPTAAGRCRPTCHSGSRAGLIGAWRSYDKPGPALGLTVQRFPLSSKLAKGPRKTRCPPIRMACATSTLPRLLHAAIERGARHNVRGLASCLASIFLWGFKREKQKGDSPQVVWAWEGGVQIYFGIWGHFIIPCFILSILNVHKSGR